VSDRQRLSALGAFSDLFLSNQFVLGAWDETGFRNSDDTDQFIRHCYDQGWVMQLNWPEWIATDEAKNLCNTAAILNTATPEQLAALLTTSIRQSRFVEGGLEAWYENGWLLAICQRAKQLSLVDNT
jgi:hypothetical protein